MIAAGTSPGTFVLDAALVLIGIPAAVYVILQIMQARSGMKSAGELAAATAAYERLALQAKEDREACARDTRDLRRELDELRGELKAHRLQYAAVIAKEVVGALEASGWVIPTQPK